MVSIYRNSLFFYSLTKQNEVNYKLYIICIQFNILPFWHIPCVLFSLLIWVVQYPHKWVRGDILPFHKVQSNHGYTPVYIFLGFPRHSRCTWSFVLMKKLVVYVSKWDFLVIDGLLINKEKRDTQKGNNRAKFASNLTSFDIGIVSFWETSRSQCSDKLLVNEVSLTVTKKDCQ